MPLQIFVKARSTGTWHELPADRVPEGKPLSLADLGDPVGNDIPAAIQFGGTCPENPKPVEEGYTNKPEIELPKAEVQPEAQEGSTSDITTETTGEAPQVKKRKR